MTRDDIGPDGTLIFSTFTCPACGHAERVEMAPNTCQAYHRCTACKTQVRAKPDACCVFCSYGDTPCPPAQLAGKNCCND